MVLAPDNSFWLLSGASSVVPIVGLPQPGGAGKKNSGLTIKAC